MRNSSRPVQNGPVFFIYVNKDWPHKDKDKDKDQTLKDQDKDMDVTYNDLQGLRDNLYT